MRYSIPRICLLLAVTFAHVSAATPPLFYKDVLPILQKRCQSCHHTGGAAPMPLVSYSDARPWAKAILEATRVGKMPPWFADPHFGSFANDAKLSEGELAALESWVKAGAPEGSRVDGPRPVHWPDGWTISPDAIVTMPYPFPIPAKSVIDYQYVILPLNLNFDRWVRAVEILPGDRAVVHHAVLYVRPPESAWLRDIPAGVPYAPPRSDSAALKRTRESKEDILAIYTPGSSAWIAPEGMAKKLPAGSDLVLQLHYTSRDSNTADRSAVGLILSTEPPKQRILTLQMGRDDLRIPPGDPDYKAVVSGTLPRDALLISLFPHMHLRGSEFDFEAFAPGGHAETLLRVKPYDFYWQLTYVLSKPQLLPRNTVLKWTGHFDNSRNNPSNPDPAAEVRWGEQSTEEMMIGFFDIAVDPSIDKKEFFTRPASHETKIDRSPGSAAQ